MSTYNPYSWMVGEPSYHEDLISPSRQFSLNRYNRRHIYVQLNTANNAIFQIGDYQTVNVPPRQWVYWPYPDTSIITQILPTFPIHIASYCTDETISELGRYGEGYNDYARTEQAFSTYVAGAATVGHYVGIELSTTATCSANIILDQAWIDGPAIPNVIWLTEGTTPDSNLNLVFPASNHRLDGATHGIVPQAAIHYQTDTATITANPVSIQVIPGTNQTDILRGTIREIPKLFAGAVGIYAQSTDATKFLTINLAWHEEYA